MNKIAALLLSLLAVRVQAAAVEVRAFSAAPVAPPSIAAPAALSVSASFAAPAATAFPLAVPALAAPAPLPAAASVAAAPEAASISAAPAPAADAGARPAALPAGEAADVPTDAQLAAMYDAARPGSPTIATLSAKGGFAAAAGQIVYRYTFDPRLVEGLRFSPMAFDPEGLRTIRAVQELTSVADSRDDPAARRFLQALGRRRAADFHDQQAQAARLQAADALDRRDDGVERRHMPRNDLGSGDYWDMAAGMNAGHFILSELEPGTRYSFFDLSPFVVAYLNAVAARKGADAAAIEADILQLKRPEKPLAVLRTKNAVHYVPGFEKKLTEMADWVAPGGRLVIQNDPAAGQRELIVEKHGALARRLIREGWSFTFEFASSRAAAHDLDTLIFTRPHGEAVSRSADETRELWARYVAAVNYANAREGY